MALAELLDGQRPRLLPRRRRGPGVLDILVILVVVSVAGLAVRACYELARTPKTATVPSSEVLLDSLAASTTVPGADLLAGRALLGLPVDAASFALIGDLPQTLSVALVPDRDSTQEDFVTNRFDGVVVLRTVAIEDDFAALLAVEREDARRMLSALPGATVHLFQPGTAGPPRTNESDGRRRSEKGPLP